MIKLVINRDREEKLFVTTANKISQSISDKIVKLKVDEEYYKLYANSVVTYEIYYDDNHEIREFVISSKAFDKEV